MIEGTEARHLLMVRRARPGDQLEIFDGLGRAWKAELLAAQEDVANCRVLEEVKMASPASVRLTIASAVPRAKRMSFLVEKCAELGVEELLPVEWDRSPRAGSSSAVERWNRLAGSAAKQSRRARLMNVAEPMSVEELLERLAGFEKVLLLKPGADGSVAAALQGLAPGSRLAALVGPEGGLADGDRDLLAGAPVGMTPVSMGTGILRVETAALALAAAVLCSDPR